MPARGGPGGLCRDEGHSLPEATRPFSRGGPGFGIGGCIFGAGAPASSGDCMSSGAGAGFLTISARRSGFGAWGRGGCSWLAVVVGQ